MEADLLNKLPFVEHRTNIQGVDEHDVEVLDRFQECGGDGVQQIRFVKECEELSSTS